MAAVAVTKNLPQEMATIDLSAYDPEQSKLMEERCILVDAQDRAYGAGDKKTCTHTNIPLVACCILTSLQAT
jgi:isopentenyl-diphosphate delta-isomerase